MPFEVVRAKFTVTKSSELGNYNGSRVDIMRNVSTDLKHQRFESTGVPVREITMSAVYSGPDTENKSFAEATPSGEIRFTLNNAGVADHFKPGETYYVDFTRA